MKRALFICSGFVFFLICILWRAPAWVAMDLLTPQLPRGLSLGQASGSVWRGQLASVQFQNIEIRQLQWRLQILKAISGAPLAVSLKHPAELRVELGIDTERRIHLNTLTADAQLDKLLHVAGLPHMGFRGALLAHASAVFSAQGCESLQGDVKLRRLDSDLTGFESIAPVAAILSCQGRSVSLKIDENNAANIRGAVTLPLNGGKPRGGITISPEPGSELFLSLQDFMGRPRNNKDFIIRF